MVFTVSFLRTTIAHQHQSIAAFVCTVDVTTGFTATMDALTNIH